MTDADAGRTGRVMRKCVPSRHPGAPSRVLRYGEAGRGKRLCDEQTLAPGSETSVDSPRPDARAAGFVAKPCREIVFGTSAGIVVRWKR